MYLELLAEVHLPGVQEGVGVAAATARAAAGGMVHLLLIPAGHQVKHFHLRPGTL